MAGVDSETRELEETSVVRSVEESSDTTALAVGISFVLIQLGLEKIVRWIVCEKGSWKGEWRTVRYLIEEPRRLYYR